MYVNVCKCMYAHFLEIDLGHAAAILSQDIKKALYLHG